MSATALARVVEAVSTAAACWIDLVRRRAALVLVLAAAATGATAYLAASELTIDTDTTAMISPELPFRRHAAAFTRAFPQFVDSIVIVVEGETPDGAEDAAISLVDGLRRDPDLFGSVFAPEIGPFFARNGLLYLDVDELDELSDRLADAEPLLADLARDPSLRGLFAVLGLGLDDMTAGKPVAGGLADALRRIAAVAADSAAGGSRALSWSELMRGSATEPNDRRRFIRIQPAIDFTSLEPAARAMAEIRRIARDRKLTPEHGVRVLLTGSAAMA